MTTNKDFWDNSLEHCSKEDKDYIASVLCKQIIYERDLAIQQLKDLGNGLGEKPKENKGKWIVVVDSYYEDGTIKENHWKCSKCGSDNSGWGEFKFCPDCGADMREPKCETCKNCNKAIGCSKHITCQRENMKFYEPIGEKGTE